MLVVSCLFYAAACDRTLNVSVSDSWPPYSFKNGSEYEGLDIEILNLLLKHNNLCANFFVYPSSSRAFEEFKKGNVDLIPAATFSQKRRAYSEFSITYRNEVMGLFHNAKSDKTKAIVTQLDKIDSPLSLLNESTVLVNRGSYYGAAFEQFSSNCKDCVVYLNQTEQRFKLLQSKRVDFVVEDALTGGYFKYQKDVVLTPVLINKSPTYFMLRPGFFNEQELQAFNLSIINNRYEINAILKKYAKNYGVDLSQ